MMNRLQWKLIVCGLVVAVFGSELLYFRSPRHIAVEAYVFATCLFAASLAAGRKRGAIADTSMNDGADAEDR